MAAAPLELAAQVGRLLSERGLTLATSESLTGGLLGATLTAIPGSSSYYLGGVIAYSAAVKSGLGGVGRAVLSGHGAVSEQTVVEMALGVQERIGSDWAIAVSGVAGPAPQEGHPPGTVWLCVVGPRVGSQEPGVQAHLMTFEGDRADVREQTVSAALGLLLRAAMGE